MLRGKGALARPELLAQLGLNVGDELVIGRSRFTIRGVIGVEPGRSLSAFSLGPRVMVDYEDLAGTGLLATGSRVVRQMLLRVPDDRIDTLTRDLQTELRPQFVRVRSYRDRQEQIGEDFLRAENYLSLVGLVIVVLGGIAVSSVTRVFVRQKIKSIAVMKCVGGTSRQILSVYLVQALGAGPGGKPCRRRRLPPRPIAAIPDTLNQIGTLTVTYGVSWSAVVQGVGVGVLVSLLFAMVPLLEVRQVKPSLLLRQETTARRVDWFQIGATVVVAGALVALASWQAASLRIGPERLPRVRRPDARAARPRLGLDARDAAARAIAVVSDAAGGAASRQARQSDARHPAGGWTRHVLHHGRARAAGESAQPVRAADGRHHAGSVSRGHPAGSTGRHEGVSRRPSATRRRIDVDSGVARAGDGTRRQPRGRRGPAGARHAVAGVHDHLSRAASKQTRHS